MASTRGSSTIRITRPSQTPFSPLQQRALLVLASVVVFGTGYSFIYYTAAETAFRTRFPSSIQSDVEASYGFLPNTVDTPYFAMKKNLFNQWFVKKAWGWTTLVAGLHLATNILAGLGVGSAEQVIEKARQMSGAAGAQNGSSSSVSTGPSKVQQRSGPTSTATGPTHPPTVPPPASSTSSPADLQVVANTIASVSARPIFRWILATGYWLLFTRWFFGPSFSERILVLTGGECIPHATSNGVAKSIDAALCRAGATATLGQAGGALGAQSLAHARPYWKGGHDVSGHVFLLVHASVYLITSVGPVLPYLFGNPHASPLARRGEEEKRPTALQRASAWAVLGLAALWCWMLLMTSVYFHTPFEKVTGLLMAVGGVAVQAVAN